MKVFINTVSLDSSCFMQGDDIQLKPPVDGSEYPSECIATVEEVSENGLVVFDSNDEYFSVKFSEVKNIIG